MGKKEHARRILDALETKKRLTHRLYGIGIVLIILGIVAFILETNLMLIIGVELLLAVLLSLSVDRQQQRIEYNIDLGFKKLGWQRPEQIDEDTLSKLRKIGGLE